jgi:hypothetical protein
LPFNPASEKLTDVSFSGYDWAIQVRKKAAEQNAVASAPFTVQQLQNSVDFREGQRRGDFPQMRISNHFVRSNDIERVLGRCCHKFELGERYVLEVNLFRDWFDNATGRELPASVKLYSTDWDDDYLRSGVAVPRPWASSFSEQFLSVKQSYDHAPEPVPGTTTEPMDFLLLWVDWILKALDDDSEAGERVV